MNWRRSIVVIAAAASAPAAAQDAASAESLHRYLQARFESVRQHDPDTHYQSGFADLNGDGRAEAVVYMSSDYFCGSGGCDVLVFTPARRGWRQVADISVGRTPIRLLNTRSRGWRDLGVFVAGGGAAPHEARVSFNGRTYGDNASVAPTVRRGTAGRVLISNDAEARRLF